VGTGPRDPEELTGAPLATPAGIPDATRMGAVHLTVADLERSLAFYRQVVGLQALARSPGRISFGADGVELLVLVEERGAAPSMGHTGLYHFALLVPERRDLAGWLAHGVRERVPLAGLSDHFVSEAIYLSDPDRHGIEIYWDRPRRLWAGQVASRLTTFPLDVDDLLGELDDPASEPFGGLPKATVMGHVHFKVARIPETIAFYRDVLGFGLMAALGLQAAFLSAAGYHHHIGANTWESADASPPPEGTAALRHATILLPRGDAQESIVERVTGYGQRPQETAAGPLVRDPSGNGLLLALAPPAIALGAT
jgi:catechol 2,3-dioxygenase